jgi:hypothetical protein
MKLAVYSSQTWGFWRSKLFCKDRQHTHDRHGLQCHLTPGQLHLLGQGWLHLLERGWLHPGGRGWLHLLGLSGWGRRHLLGLSGWGRRHLLPPSLSGWLAWRCHARTWGRRSSWIHFLVTEDGGAGVFLVPRLTKFLAGRDLYWQDGEPSGGRSRASEPVSAQESSLPQKESCGHKEMCDRSYFIQNTKCPTTPLSCSILKKNYELFIFLLIFMCFFMGPNFWGKQSSVISKKSVSSLV